MAKVRIKKTYVAHDLSRKRFLTERHSKRIRNNISSYNNIFRGYQIDEEDGHIKRAGKSSRWERYCKRQSHRRMRRLPHDEIILKGNSNNKVFDYWWIID